MTLPRLRMGSLVEVADHTRGHVQIAAGYSGSVGLTNAADFQICTEPQLCNRASPEHLCMRAPSQSQWDSSNGGPSPSITGVAKALETGIRTGSRHRPRGW